MSHDDAAADEIRHFSVLAEELLSQNQAIFEVVSDIQKKIEPIDRMQEDIEDIKTDIATIKRAVTDTNAQVHDHETRITKLEQSAA